MTINVIIILCSLLLVAYIFDLTSSKTKIPAVILLLVLGWVCRQVLIALDLSVLDFSSILPILGTIGLILIVLEGALELELNRHKVDLIKKSFLGSFFSMLAFAFLVALMFHYAGHSSFKNSLLNTIPLAVISSAIAIPSVRNLRAADKEFVIYESSLSDISGVLFFNFIALNETIGFSSFGQFILQVLVMLIISFIATAGLSYLLSKIDHHIKFVPIILMVLLIYAVSKIFHLPGLILF